MEGEGDEREEERGERRGGRCKESVVACKQHTSFEKLRCTKPINIQHVA